MPRSIVLDDTRCHPELAERITELLDTVAPLVEETTELPLPTTVRYRLMQPKAWRQAQMEYRQRLLYRDVAELHMPPEAVNAMRLGLKLSGFMPVLAWPMVMGATLIAADGRCETLIMPRALRHGGLLAYAPALAQLVAHELVHHAQAEAHGDDPAWYSPQAWGVEARSVSTIVEGHATWAHRQVTDRLFAEPVDPTRLQHSLRYRFHSRLPGIRRLGPRREAYEQGARLVAHAAAAKGIDLINRVWKDIALLPTADEIAAPDAWLGRIAP